MTGAEYSQHPNDLHLLLRDIERFVTFDTLDMIDAPAVQQFYRTADDTVVARALATQPLAECDAAAISAIAERIAAAPGARATALDILRKADIDPPLIFLVSAIFRALGITAPIAEIDAVPQMAVAVHDAMLADGWVQFSHDSKIAPCDRHLIIDLNDPVAHGSHTQATIAETTVRFPVTDTAWLQASRVACPSFAIIATA